ncbi:hypothetical protein FQB35_15655 (plasmid) [Crassaminicella thermophila]|uniref:Uncharacterized protein n=1 Tax=Crassaminicella thermophila TaxID=2599308 RepID=A0A5C0SHU8_CRATE|nr:hypothetical protein [Crassaminicella thermophila]QEK13760.1 hypothetical protein FQB35_15655 [Crassaminicella thermophila]
MRKKTATTKKKRMNIEDFIDEDYKRRTEEAERKYAEQIKASEMKEYKLSEEELEKYRKMQCKTEEMPLEVKIHSSLNRGNSEMRLNLEKLRKHVEEEKMTAEEIAKKYDYPIRNVKAMIGKLKPKKEPYEDENTQKQNFKALKLKVMEFKGESLVYRMQDDVLSIIKGNQGIRVELKELDTIIRELQELKEAVNNG